MRSPYEIVVNDVILRLWRLMVWLIAETLWQLVVWLISTTLVTPLLHLLIFPIYNQWQTSARAQRLSQYLTHILLSKHLIVPIEGCCYHSLYGMKTGLLKLKCPTEHKFNTFFDLPDELMTQIAFITDVNISHLLQLNKKCVFAFGPILYQKVHFSIPVISTEVLTTAGHIRLRSPQNTTGAKLRVNAYLRNTTQFNSTTNQLGILGQKYQFLQRNKKADNHDFMGFFSSSKRKPYKRTLKDRMTHVWDHDLMIEICNNVMSNEKSIMRQFIRQFFVDIRIFSGVYDPSYSISRNPGITLIKTRKQGEIKSTHSATQSATYTDIIFKKDLSNLESANSSANEHGSYKVLIEPCLNLCKNKELLVSSLYDMLIFQGQETLVADVKHSNIDPPHLVLLTTDSFEILRVLYNIGFSFLGDEHDLNLYDEQGYFSSTFGEHSIDIKNLNSLDEPDFYMGSEVCDLIEMVSNAALSIDETPARRSSYMGFSHETLCLYETWYDYNRTVASREPFTIEHQIKIFVIKDDGP